MDFQRNVYYISAVLFVIVLLCSGCVERQLTVKTEPTDALVVLNDEEVGNSPVTLNFEWYGDYNVRISKTGYQTLRTHRNLERPIRDRFPFDLFADVLWPKRIVDKYEWTFQLEPYEAIDRQNLIDSAVSLKKDALTELAESGSDKEEK